MKIKFIHKYAAILTMAFAALLSLAACSDDENFVLRSDSLLNFTAAEQQHTFTVCTNGPWTITTDADWIKLSQTEGQGDGHTREVITVTALRNISAARTDSFVVHAAGRDLPVIVNQEEGHPITFGTPSLSSSLQAGESAEGVSIVVPYTYGYKGEQLAVSVSLDGDAANGLTVEPFTTVLESENGNIEIPLSGTPTTSGSLHIAVSSDESTKATASFSTEVLSKVLLEQHFDLMEWGGDVVANLPGIKGGFTGSAGYRDIDPTVTPKACKATTDGSNDAFLTMGENWRQTHGVSGWSGARVYEHPGYVKMGTAKAIGWITTAPISNLGKGVSTVKVTCRVAQYYGEKGGTLTISASKGTPSISEYTYKHAGTKHGSTWEDVSFTVTGVDASTTITFSTKGNKRFCIDDIVISEGE